MQTGYLYAKENDYDIAIQFDGDGQHSAADIKRLLEVLEQGYDMVIGSRFIDKNGFQTSFLRRIGIKWFSLIALLIGRKLIYDTTSGFRACNKNLIRLFSENYPDDYPEPETLIILMINKYKITEVAVIMNDRYGGKSSINFLRSCYYMVKVTLAMFFAAYVLTKKGKVSP